MYDITTGLGDQEDQAVGPGPEEHDDQEGGPQHDD